MEAPPEPDPRHHETAAKPDFGARLREARQLAALSQEVVAARTGYAARSLARWESGECDPGFGAIMTLATVYDVSLDWLAGRTPVPRSLQPGQVVVDEEALDEIRRLVAAKCSLRDVPPHLIRHPGVDYAFVVPKRLMVMGLDAARAVDAQMQALVKQLRASG